MIDAPPTRGGRHPAGRLADHYQYAFTQNDFNGSAAISVGLLLVSALCAGLFVARGRLFETE